MNDREMKRKSLLKSSYMMALFICIFFLILSTGNASPNLVMDWVYFAAIFSKVVMCAVVAGAVKTFIDKLLGYFDGKYGGE